MKNIKNIINYKKNYVKQNNFENAVNDIAKDSNKTNEWKQFRKNWTSKY